MSLFYYESKSSRTMRDERDGDGREVLGVWRPRPARPPPRALAVSRGRAARARGQHLWCARAVWP